MSPLEIDFERYQRRIAELEAEVERLRLHLRGCCGEDYESCEVVP